MPQFSGANAALEQAIEADDAGAVDAALASGATANARGTHGVTPLEYAIGIFRKQAAIALVRAHADPNLKDAEGDSAISLAVMAYDRDPQLLDIVLDAGGDPNTRRPDGDPVITRFADGANLGALTHMRRRGADIDADVNAQPMIVTYAIANDWDVVWHLIELGARTDTPRVRDGMMFAFKVPGATLPDSPLYPAKVKVWHYLKQQGLDPTPPAGM